ncbi:hypothetical protein BX286_0019 [Streptomyces sp. 3211.6]|uniref:WD40 repeat domain-containing protein n=1 Tax=Streptomyces sp. 3211.6 TaxID=1938845 RepID=UPI000EABDFE7|nr:hypothetical protein [Streptomyces sp. 3211.6]RKT02155.1 hypothetical protein BX286_0019 [Streptomyces sp. 3211.6]
MLAALHQGRLIFLELNVEDAGDINSIAFSSDGSLLAVAAKNSPVRLWETATLEPAGLLQTYHVHGATDIAFSPAGGVLVSMGEDGAIRLVDTVTGMPLGLFPSVISQSSSYTSPFPRYSGRGADAFALSPDGRMLAVLAEVCRVCVWDTDTGDLVGDIHTGANPVTRIAFAPDGRLATAIGNVVQLWNPATAAPAGALSVNDDQHPPLSARWRSPPRAGWQH